MFPEPFRRHWDTVGFALLLCWFWWRCGLAPLLLILFAAAVHEGGHLLALYLFGAPSGQLRLSPLGAVLTTEDLRLSYPAEIVAVLSGPAANLLAAFLLGSCFGLDTAAGAHWVLGIFNLLPAASLDGGRLVQLLCCWIFDPVTGERIAGAVGGICAVILALAILSVVILSQGNLWLLPAAVGMAISGIQAVKL